MYLLTYDHPHRKTQDVLFQLMVRGIRPTLLVGPWKERKQHKPLYQVRPTTCAPFWPDQLAKGFDLPIVYGMEEEKGMSYPVKPGKVLVGGAGILPEEFVNTFEVFNGHPGIIPRVRGLDSLKWAIYYGEDIGVTIHIIDKDCDMGKIVRQERLSLFPTDTIHSIGQRLYELEVHLLAMTAVMPSIGAQGIREPANEPNRRMPKELELQTVERLKQRLAGENLQEQVNEAQR